MVHLTDTGSRSPNSQGSAENAAPEMGDIFDQLAKDLKRTIVEQSARVAEIHLIRAPANTYGDGWNAACRAIASKIREL